jgi:3-oxosteroid 1-dehydrogenase
MPAEAAPRKQVDLVVVGSGAAGLTGALVAAIGGARVLVVEKTELVGGTTAMSGGGIWIACNRHMDSVGVPDSRQAALAYLRACTGGQGEDEHLVMLVDQGAAMIDFLEDKAGIRFNAWAPQGGMIDYRPWLEGARKGGRTLEPAGFSLARLGEWAPRLRKDPRLRSDKDLAAYYRESKHLWPPSALAGMKPPPADCDTYWRGPALAGWLLGACLAHGVEVWTGTTARAIAMDGPRIAGIRVDREGGEQHIDAPAVLMASGGYANNQALKRLWLTRPLQYTCEIEANQGDGHLMGQAVGAQMAGLGDAWWLPHIPLGLDGGLANIAGTRAHDDGQWLRSAFHERGDQLLRLRREVRHGDRRGSAQSARLVPVRPAGRGTIHAARAQDSTR